MVARGQARWIRGHRALRLAHWHELPQDGGRTRTARFGILAGMGRSQVYTIADSRGRVHDFKHIFPEELPMFYQATIDCMATEGAR